MEASKSNRKSGFKNSSILQMPRAQILDVLAARRAGLKIKGDAIWDSALAFFDRLEAAENTAGLFEDSQLKPYQKHGAQWFYDLYHLHLGGILADEMGLGKTIQALAFLYQLQIEEKLGRSLIIVPTTLIGHWLSESERFYPDLRMFRFEPKASSSSAIAEPHFQGCVLVTYGLFLEHETFFSSLQWNLQIYDEAQNLKTLSAKRTSLAKSLPARVKFALTGTPFENRLEELFSLVDLVVPGALGSLRDFRARFVTSVAADTSKKENFDELRQILKPIFLRRTKAAVLEQLPPKTESKVMIPFETRQLKLYRDVALSANSSVQAQIEKLGEARSQIFMLTALLRLRQICSDPASLPNTDYPLLAPKLVEAVDLIERIISNNESILVFTQFLSTYHRLKALLSEKQIENFGIHGSLSSKAREAEIKAFTNSPNPSVFLLTLKTGGVGLNLTKASFVVHIEPWWNPAVENQATDRAHRIGQTKAVTIYRMIVQDSVEEKIEILKTRKSELFESIVESSAEAETNEQISGRLTKKDFDFLLSSSHQDSSTAPRSLTPSIPAWSSEGPRGQDLSL
jgi:SNF2 family DNA or RNA helicase